METKIISQNLVAASLILTLGFGIALAQEHQNGESSAGACQAEVLQNQEAGKFSDVSGKFLVPVNFSALLSKGPEGLESELSKFFPKKAITRKDFALLLHQYVAALNVEADFQAWVDKNPESKVSKKESIPMFRKVFGVSAAAVKKEFKKNKFRGLKLLRGETSVVAYAFATKKLSEAPEEYLCGVWEKNDAELFGKLFAPAESLPEAENTPEAPATEPQQASDMPSTRVTSGHVCGTPIHVAEKDSVQAALDSACAGDTVFIAPGTYRENIQVKKNNISLKGEEGTRPEQIVLDGNGTGNVVTVNSEGVSDFVLDGVTVQNSLLTGAMPGSAGIYIAAFGNAARIRLQNLIVKNNGYGIVIENTGAGRVDIKKNLILDNSKAGILSNNIGSSEVHIINNTLVGNDENGVADTSGSGVRVYRNNIIVNNGYFGIATHKNSQRKIFYNNAWGNSSGSYGEGEALPYTTEFFLDAANGNVSRNPDFMTGNNPLYKLQRTSTMVDQGDPDLQYIDPDNSRNDIGAYPYGY